MTDSSGLVVSRSDRKGREGMLGAFVQQRDDGLMVGAGGVLGTVNVQKLMEWAKNALS